MKKLIWIGGTRRRLKDFPEQARREAGKQLWAVQHEEEPIDWRPMPSIGIGAIEIRIHYPHEYRVIYVATHPEGIYVLHALEKKTQQTPHKEVARARANYAEMEKKRKIDKTRGCANMGRGLR